MLQQHAGYYLPKPSPWPIIGSIGLFCFMLGAANWLHGHVFGPYLFAVGAAIIIFMMTGWFRTVINENQAGLYNNQQLDRSFRWGMGWFIFSEVMFFSAFFGALFYVRMWAVPWLAGQDGYATTAYLLWPNFKAAWPLLHTPDPAMFIGPKGVMDTWGIPALNTLLLLSSGVTITIAHWGLLQNKRKQLITFMIFTILLGITFLYCQAHEYILAYTEHGLKLSSGIYGTTFFMLTGFHGLHVTLGTIMLVVITIRCIKGHFTPEKHFAFEGVAWYWHFVDVVWLFLFIFVYWF